MSIPQPQRREVHEGSSPRPVPWFELETLLDSIFGREWRDLPTSESGSVNAYWHDADGNRYEANHSSDLHQAYESGQVAHLAIHGRRTGHLYGDIELWVDPLPHRARVALEGAPEPVASTIAAVQKLFCAPVEGMLVFISWGGVTGRKIAEALQPVLQARLGGVDVFVSSTSIDPGDDPLRRMLENGVLKASALIVVLTRNAVDRPWVIWETASAWARQKLVLPLFADVRPEDVPGPLTSKVQGVHLAERDAVDRALRVLASRLKVASPKPLTDAEFEKLSKAVADPLP